MARLTSAQLGKVIWLLLCLLVLVFAWSNRHASSTDLAVLWMLVVLTFPVALTLSSLGAGLFYLLGTYAGVTIPGGFLFNLCFWVLSVGGAYWFWTSIIFARKHSEP